MKTHFETKQIDFTVEMQANIDSSGAGVRVSFPGGTSVMIYPTALRDGRFVMLVNPCRGGDKGECVGTVVVPDSGACTVVGFGE